MTSRCSNSSLEHLLEYARASARTNHTDDVLTSAELSLDRRSPTMLVVQLDALPPSEPTPGILRECLVKAVIEDCYEQEPTGEEQLVVSPHVTTPCLRSPSQQNGPNSAVDRVQHAVHGSARPAPYEARNRRSCHPRYTEASADNSRAPARGRVICVWSDPRRLCTVRSAHAHL